MVVFSSSVLASSSSAPDKSVDECRRSMKRLCVNNIDPSGGTYLLVAAWHERVTGRKNVRVRHILSVTVVSETNC